MLHITKCVLLLSINKWDPTIETNHSLFMHSQFDGYFGSFQFGAVMHESLCLT